MITESHQSILMHGVFKFEIQDSFVDFDRTDSVWNMMRSIELHVSAKLPRTFSRKWDSISHVPLALES